MKYQRESIREIETAHTGERATRHGDNARKVKTMTITEMQNKTTAFVIRQIADYVINAHDPHCLKEQPEKEWNFAMCILVQCIEQANKKG